MNTKQTTTPRGRPALPEGEKTVTSSIRLTPSRWAKLRHLGMAWLARAIDRARAPDVSLLNPMAPIADLLSKDRVTSDERRVVDADLARKVRKTKAAKR